MIRTMTSPLPPPEPPATAPTESDVEAVSLATIEHQGTKLVVKERGLTRFVQLPVDCLHNVEAAGVVTVVLNGERAGTVLVHLSAVDAESRALIAKLYRREAPDIVQRALATPGSRVVGAPNAAPVAPVEPGTLEFDGHVIVLTINEEQWFSLPDADDRPRLVGRSTAEGFAVVLELELADRTRRRVGIEPAARSSAERATLFLRSTKSPAQQTLITWEYRVVKNMLASSFEEQLNTLGQQGWEVVAITGLDGVMTLTGNKLMAVLKRRTRRR
ncbi:MAG TPA: hypothetical protein DCR14_06560 [Acidimicrobiaceae bacterium]|nr:hypothetical protein [Acidimicrobiaceae bacterium]